MCCPGRVRIKVPVLYRSKSEKTRIESALSEQEHVVAAYANPLTGNVLILFDLSVPSTTFLVALGARDASGANQKPKRSHRPSKPPAPAARRRSGHPGGEAYYDKDIYPPWHLRDADAALAFHGSSTQTGLSASGVDARLREGLNLLPQPRARSAADILFSQFNSIPVLLLGVSAGVSILTGGISEALAIAAVLALNAGIGFVTERRAEATIASLSELVDDSVPVVRDGKMREVHASGIVPGDILVLAPGVRVAADARLVQSGGLTVDESALTGESQFVAKFGAALARPAVLGDRTNMTYMGTAIAAGTGLAVVVGTGSNTEIGVVQSLMERTEQPQTPLQKQLDHLGNQLVLLSLATCACVFGIGLLRGTAWLQMLKTSISLAVAAVPEGLPAVATTSLARGIRLMRAKHMLIRRLQAVETLGAIHTICLDKTGTLTMNRMSVAALQAGARHYEAVDGVLRWQGDALNDSSTPEIRKLLQVCVLCNEVVASNGGSTTPGLNGSSTEKALIELARQAGIQVLDLQERYPLLHAQLRAEGRNYMQTDHTVAGTSRTFSAAKGNPGEVLDLCGFYQCGEEVVPLTADAKEALLAQNERMAQQQLRILGFAYAEALAPAAEAANGLIWVGLVGLADPLRAGAKTVIGDLHRAGIRTAMVTGDQSTTAYAIGKSLSLNNGDALKIFDSEYLDSIDPEALKVLVAQADIFARVSPARKLQIVRALQQGGEVVGMTGDGINDGPALQAADVGIAMGLHGTDLARSAADVVLKDDRLETILEAIREGRTITSNIEKSLHFLISSNLSEILVMLTAAAAGIPSPLTPMQLLWLNLLSDVLPAIALAAEPAEDDVMKRPPRDPATPMIGARQLKRYGREGAVLTGGALASYFYGIARYGAGPRASTLAFNTLVLGQLLHALSCRSDKHGIFSRGASVKDNKLNLAIAGSVGLQVLANVIPGLRSLLGPSSVGVTDITMMLAGAGVPLMLNEAVKNADGGSLSGRRPLSPKSKKDLH
jgi:Ca2+-transporting ATPase